MLLMGVWVADDRDTDTSRMRLSSISRTHVCRIVTCHPDKETRRRTPGI